MATTTVGEIQLLATINTSKYRQGAKEIQRTNEKIEGSTDKTTSKSDRSWLKTGAVIGAVSGVVQSVFTKAMSAVSNSIDGAIKRVDILNNFPKIMSNMGISAEDSKSTIKDLAEQLKGLPTPLDQAALSVQRLTTKTGDVKKAKDVFLALNNAIIAGGAPMELQSSAMEQFSQSFAKGKPDMMEWRTLMSAMPAQLTQLAKSMKFKSADELGEALRTGKVSMEDFADELIKLNKTGVDNFPSFAQQAKNSAGGIQTGMANMRTAITRGVTSILEVFGQGNISNAISAFGDNFEKVLKSIGGGIKSVIEWFDKNKKAIFDTVTAIRDYLEPKFTALWNTISTKLIPILKDLWKNVIESLVPVLGTVLVGAIGLVTDALNLALSAFSWVWQALKDGNPIVWLLIGTFGALATAMTLDATFNALTTGFNTLRLVTIPNVLTTLNTLKIAVATPMVFGAVVIGAALAAFALIRQKAEETMAVIRNTQNAIDKASKSDDEVINRLRNLSKNGTPEQRARAESTLRKLAETGAFASGGFTGRGAKYDIAGLVHRGEFVIPKEMVDQNTGLPKVSNNSQTINQYNTINNNVDFDVVNRNLAWRLSRA